MREVAEVDLLVAVVPAVEDVELLEVVDEEVHAAAQKVVPRSLS